MSGKRQQRDPPTTKVYDSVSPRVPEPDQKVTDLENQLVQADERNVITLKDLKLEDKLEEVLDRDDWRTDLPWHPGFGNTGEPIKLWTNYFQMNIANGKFYRYNIKVKEGPSKTDFTQSTTGGESSAAATPRGSVQDSSQHMSSRGKAGKKDGPSDKQLARLIELLLAHEDYAELKNHIVSDFSATLLSTRKLPRSPMITTLKYQMEGESQFSDRARRFQTTVDETESFDLSYLHKYLTSSSTYGAFENREWFIQALNIFLRHHARTSSNVSNIGRKAFPLEGKEKDELDLLHCLSALRGYYSSVRLATSRILVNVNISHSTFYQVGKEGWRLHYFMSILEEQITKRDKKTEDVLEAAKNANYSLENLEIFLRGLRVKVSFTTENNPNGVIKVRRIDGLAHVDDGRHGKRLLKYPPKVKFFGAGAKDVEFYDSSETMNKTQAEIDEAKRKRGSGGGKGGGGGSIESAAPRGRAPTNKYISVAVFAKEEYDAPLQDVRFPVVNVGNRDRPVYLNPFFCWVIPGQVYSPKLNPELMDQMLQFAVRKPWENAKSIKDKGHSLVGLSSKTNPSLKTFGVEVKEELLLVKGCILAHPSVKYGTGQSDTDIRFAEWNMLGRQFYSPKPLKKCTCLSIVMGRQGQSNIASLEESLDTFTQVLNNCGIGFSELWKPDVVRIRDERDSRLEAKICALAKEVEFLLIILPRKHTLLYNKVKLFGDVRYGVHTVCVVGSGAKFFKGDPKCLANVAHKFNLKLRGTNHTLEKAQLGIISEGKTMVVGYDVTHPAPGSNDEAPSIAAMVASIDKELAQWPADIYKNKAKQEMVDALGSMFKSRLGLWRKENGSLPENVLIYRDGVSEGQYKTVIELEINKQLRPVCQSLYGLPLQQQGLPRITFIVVGKRHHTRFFPTTASNTANGISQIDSRTSNPVGGTVVDRGITEARNWDFFLQSHMAIQGTAKPAHHIVLLDEIFKDRPLPEGMGFSSSADVLENLTHNMCYLFGRATKAVSICPPAYYADIACDRARRYLDRFYNAPVRAYNRANDDRVLAEALDSEIQVDDKLKKFNVLHLTGCMSCKAVLVTIVPPSTAFESTDELFEIVRRHFGQSFTSFRLQ